MSSADIATTRADGPATTPSPAEWTEQVVVRRVSPGSVARLSAIFYLCVCAVLLVAGVVLWIGAALTGFIGNIESFFRDAGFDGFRFAPFQLFRAFLIMGVVLVAAGTAANVLLALLFNALSDTVGGLRVTLAEDVERAPRR